MNAPVFPHSGRMTAGTTSARLNDLWTDLRADPAGTISLDGIMTRLGEAGFGLAIVVLSLPSFIPVPGLPIGFVTGVLLLLLARQMARREDHLRLPDWLARRTMRRAPLIGALERGLPWIARCEGWLRSDRLARLMDRPDLHLWMAWLVALLAALLIVPIPFGNQVPAAALVVLGLARLENDGLAFVIALVLTVLAVAWTVVLVFSGAWLAQEAWAWVQAL
jgi:hypothetical protein